KLRGHQIVLGEAMVDLDVELVVVTVVCTRTEPVLVNASREIRLWKQAHHLLCDGINQIPCDAGSGLKIRRQLGIPRADVCGDVVKGNERAAYVSRSAGVVGSGVWVPNLTGSDALSARALEHSPL